MSAMQQPALVMDLFERDHSMLLTYPCLSGILKVTYGLKEFKPLLIRCDFESENGNIFIVTTRDGDDLKPIYYVSWTETEGKLEHSPQFTMAKKIACNAKELKALLQVFIEMNHIAKNTVKNGEIVKIENFDSFYHVADEFRNVLERNEIDPPAYTPPPVPPHVENADVERKAEHKDFPVISQCGNHRDALFLSCNIEHLRITMRYNICYIMGGYRGIEFYVGHVDDTRTKTCVYTSGPNTKVVFGLSADFGIASFLHEHVGKHYAKQHNMFELMKEFFRVAYRTVHGKEMIQSDFDGFFSDGFGIKW